MCYVPLTTWCGMWNLVTTMEFFVYSWEFAAERWNNIWERYNFHGFLAFAWYCKESGDDVYGQEGQSLFSKLTCCMQCICKWIWTFLVQLYFSWMCMMVFQQQQTNLFFSQTAFCIFWKLRDVFQLFHGQGERFWNLWWVWSYLRMFWKWWWIQPTWIHQCEAECFWCVWNLCDSAAVFKTGQVQEDQHSTVHAAWTANLLCSRRFLCGKELSDWCSESRCFGVLCFCLNTRRGGGRPHCVR